MSEPIIVLIIIVTYTLGIWSTIKLCKFFRGKDNNEKEDITITNRISSLSWLGFLIVLFFFISFTISEYKKKNP